MASTNNNTSTAWKPKHATDLQEAVTCKGADICVGDLISFETLKRLAFAMVIRNDSSVGRTSQENALKNGTLLCCTIDSLNNFVSIDRSTKCIERHVVKVHQTLQDSMQLVGERHFFA